MYYIRIGESEPATLHYYCRNCGHVDDKLTVNNISVSKTSNGQQPNVNNFVNKYTKFDPTLPRTTNMPCPNSNCATNDEKNNVDPEIVYIRYDEDELKYIYICSKCDTTWTN